MSHDHDHGGAHDHSSAHEHADTHGHGQPAAPAGPAPANRDTDPPWATRVARVTFMATVAGVAAYVTAVVVYVFGTN